MARKITDRAEIKQIEENTSFLKNFHTETPTSYLSTLYKIFDYIHSLKANACLPTIQALPTVSEKLLTNCYEKKWLFPLSHVILSRDAQYQLLGKKKYKHEILLQPNSSPFTPINKLSEYQKKMISRLTIELALNIQAVLDKILKNTVITNISNTFKKKLQEENFSRNKNAIDSISSLLGEQAIRLKFEDYSPFALSVPICDTDVLEVKLAVKLNLNNEQLKQLILLLPHLLMKRTNSKKEIHANELPEELIDAVEAIRKFLNPNIYFSNNEETVLVKLKDPYSILQNSKFAKKTQNSINYSQIWKTFSSFFYLTDMTFMSLWMCNGLHPSNEASKTLPEFLKSCFKKLYANLMKYKKTKHICWFLGIEELTENENKDIISNPNFNYIKLYIKENITWEIAKKFLAENIIKISNKKTTEERHSVQAKNIKRLWKEPINNISSGKDMERLACYVAFSQTLEESLHLLENKVLQSLITLSPSLITKISQGGESL